MKSNIDRTFKYCMSPLVRACLVRGGTVAWPPPPMAPGDSEGAAPSEATLEAHLEEEEEEEELASQELTVSWLPHVEDYFLS